MPAPGQAFQPMPGHQLQNGHPHPAPAPAPVLPIYDFKYRAPGRGMFMPWSSSHRKHVHHTNTVTRLCRRPLAERSYPDTP
jgi:hypothetical protein